MPARQEFSARLVAKTATSRAENAKRAENREGRGSGLAAVAARLRRGVTLGAQRTHIQGPGGMKNLGFAIGINTVEDTVTRIEQGAS